MTPNLSSALENPEIVDECLRKECQHSHMAGPFDAPPVLPIHTPDVGVVSKKSGGHRLIMHLSAPAGNSINDGIEIADYSFHMVTVDTIVDHIMHAGRGALLCKIDLKHAFRLCLVNPKDWPVLGMRQQGKFYIDKVLPFGLRSALALFNCLAGPQRRCRDKVIAFRAWSTILTTS